MKPPSAFDWFARVVMLVLAGMVSLSIIGSIAAIPSGSIGGRIGIEQPRPEQPAPEAPGQQAPPPEAATPPEEGGAQADALGTTTAVAPAPAEEPDPERWLEAITYALLALAGIAALAALILWRGLHERRRIADALEALAARERR